MRIFTAIADLLRALIGPLVSLGAYLTGRRQAKTEGALEAAERIAAAQAKGRAAVAEAQADLSDGKTPEQIVRENDGRWK